MELFNKDIKHKIKIPFPLYLLCFNLMKKLYTSIGKLIKYNNINIQYNFYYLMNKHTNRPFHKITQKSINYYLFDSLFEYYNTP